MGISDRNVLGVLRQWLAMHFSYASTHFDFYHFEGFI